MNNKPSISIITVVFNGALFIEATIQSVIIQTNKDFEYIIVDGGSTDGTIEIIRKYDNQISKWISEPDSGLYDAMNKGIGLATGEFLWFINAGDEIYDNEVIHKIITENFTQADIIYGEAMIIDENRNEVGMRRQKTPEVLTWNSFKIGMVVSHQSILIRKSVAPLYNLQYKCSSDIDWIIKSLKSSTKTINSKMILSRFMDGGRSKHTILTNLKERYIIMVENYGLFSTIINHFRIAFRFIFYVLRNRRF
jgi:glycosyltransferase involved in cell wall biosynthesis